jgi:colanic acid/amylovoran biosynthesis glycosyltransferase
MKIAYLMNTHPMTSTTFVRREIRAIEALGATVLRYALRPGADLIDPEDKMEEAQTRYVVKNGFGEVVRRFVATLLSRPLLTSRVIVQAVKIGWRSDRGLLRNLAYVAEAAVVAHWCRRDTVQHLHAHFGTNSAAIAMLASQLSGIPFSFTAHGPDEFERATLLSLDVKLEHAAFVVCVSAFGRSQYMRWTRPDLWRKIVVVHCGLDISFFDSRLHPPPPNPRFVCVGRLSEQKAQIVLVSAVRRLRDEGVRCEVVLAGDGPMRDLIENSIRQAGLQGEVTITGWISGDRVKAEISAARALVLPSFAENMPVVIMEAFALGRPVISTYIAGIPELVHPQKTGWLVPAGDEIALAKAMRDALNAPVEQLVAFGAAGRAHVIEQHDSVKEAIKLRQLFEGHLPANSCFYDG